MTTFASSDHERADREAADHARRSRIVEAWINDQPEKDRARYLRMDLLEQEAAMAQQKWMREMDTDTRKALRRMGIQGAATRSHKVSGHSPYEQDDAANHPSARTEAPADDVTIEDRLVELYGLRQSQARGVASFIEQEKKQAEERAAAAMLPKLVGSILREQNVKISMLGLAYAVGLDALNGLGSMRDQAEANGVSPEAISKKKRQWQEELNLPVNAHGKKKEAREALSKAQKTKHWRNKKA